MPAENVKKLKSNYMGITINRKVAGYFEVHPKVDAFWLTSDYNAFFNEANANLQAANLQKQGKDGSVTKVTRAQVDQWLAEAAKAGTEEDNAPALQQALDDAKAAFSAAKTQLAADNAALATAQSALDAAKAGTDIAAVTASQSALDAATAKAKGSAAAADAAGAAVATAQTALDAAVKAGKADDAAAAAAQKKGKKA